MSNETARLAAEIRRHITDLYEGDQDGHDNMGVWWMKRDPTLDLPEALAAGLIAAGWRPPPPTPRRPPVLKTNLVINYGERSAPIPPGDIQPGHLGRLAGAPFSTRRDALDALDALDEQDQP